MNLLAASVNLVVPLVWPRTFGLALLAPALLVAFEEEDSFSPLSAILSQIMSTNLFYFKRFFIKHFFLIKNQISTHSQKFTNHNFYTKKKQNMHKEGSNIMLFLFEKNLHVSKSEYF